MKSKLSCIQLFRFEEEERMRKYLQGQRRQGLDKVKSKLECYVNVMNVILSLMSVLTYMRLQLLIAIQKQNNIGSRKTPASWVLNF